MLVISFGNQISLELNIFIHALMKIHKKNFVQSLPLYTSCLFSMSLNDNIVDIEKSYGICSLSSAEDDFSGLFLHPPLFTIKDPRSAWTINGALSDLRYWWNSNILLSLEEFITLQKSLILHTFLLDSSLFLVLNEGRQFKH